MIAVAMVIPLAVSKLSPEQDRFQRRVAREIRVENVQITWVRECFATEGLTRIRGS